MAYTQDEIGNIVNSIVNQYAGQSIAYFGSYPGECTVPVAYYVDKLRGTSPVPAMANNRADGWGTNFPAALGAFFTHEVFQHGKSYPEGTIIMWPYPHIALVVSSNGGNTAKVFQQNASPDGSPCHISDQGTTTCSYALVPKTVAPPSKPVIPYTVQIIDPKKVRLNKDISEWDLSYDNLVAIGNNPRNNVSRGTIVTVSAILHHNIGSDYYLPDPTLPYGYNVVDCDDYKEPDPVITPIIIPSPRPNPIPPSGALPVPTPNMKYYVQRTILAFLAYTKAAAHEDASTTIPQGNYYIYKQSGGMLNLTKTPGVAGYWINPADNVVDQPVPKTVDVAAPISPNSWKSTYSSFSDDRTPLKYVFLSDWIIHDYGDQRPDVPATKYSEINVYGTFVKDGKLYYRPKLQADKLFQYYYGIPDVDPLTSEYIIEQYDEVYNSKTSTADHIVTNNIHPLDRLVIIGETVGKWWDIITHKKSK